jgi:predicted nucleotidyltransferase
MVTEELINGYVRKIVETVDPDAVILFGSYARNQASSDSDID